MTVIYQTTDNIGSGTRFTFTLSGDTYYVKSGVLVGSTNGTAVSGTQGTQSVHVDGTVSGGNDFGIFLSGGNNSVTVGTGGVVTTGERGAGSACIFFGNGGLDLNNTLNNHGLISSPTTIAVLGTDVAVTNTGTIHGSSGVFVGLFDAPGSQVVNSGSISANDHLSAFVGTRFNNGVFTEGDDTSIINTATGTITAVSATGAGVRIGDPFAGGNGSTVHNEGTITSAQAFGVDASLTPLGTGITVTNLGTIAGGAGSVRLSQNADSLVNRGTLDGDVVLGAGDDTLDTRDGTVLGTIDGGTGFDVYFVSDADVVIIDPDGGHIFSEASFDLAASGTAVLDLNLIGLLAIDGWGSSQANSLTGNLADNRLFGRGGADTVRGGGGDDRIEGGAGADSLDGDSGNDLVIGGLDGDDLLGSDGNDTLVGLQGRDTLTGGGDEDVFRFRRVADDTVANADVITDFERGIDLIDLSRIDANANTAANDAFTFVTSFTGVAGQLRVRESKGFLEGDTDGDGSTDFRVSFIGTTPTESDIIL